MASELSGGSSSSKLPQPLTAADMAPLLKSKDSNKASDLKSLKTDLLHRIKLSQGKLQKRAWLSLQKSIDKAVRPVKLNNINKEYLDKLDHVEEDKRKLASTQIKALKFDNTYIVDVIVYATHNPNQLDEATGKIPNKIKPAFTDIVGNRYWMVSIGDGVR